MDLDHGKSVHDACLCEYACDDAAESAHCGAHRRLRSNLYGGIRQAGQQAGQAGAADGGDPQGIPSIVYGIFGYVFFNVALHFGFSMLSGALTLSIMILPLILRTTEEALMAVPDSYREGSFGLGAGKLRTVFRIVLPSAMPACWLA